MYWHPETCERKKALYSTNAEILVRFVKESALNKREMLPGLVIVVFYNGVTLLSPTRSPDLDHVDVTARQETLTSCQGQPVLLQLPVVPSYALTVRLA